MIESKTFSTSSNFDGLFMCTFTDDSLTIFFISNPPQLGNKLHNTIPKLHLETRNGKTSLNSLEQEKSSRGKKKGVEFYNT